MSQVWSWLPAEHSPGKGTFLALFSSAIIVLIEFAFAISASVYMFPGDLSAHIGLGIGAIMLASVVPTFVALCFGTNPSTLCGARGASIPLLAVLIAGVNGAMVATGQTERLLPTLVASIGFASVAGGILFLALGVFKWGNLIRSIPFPVMGGFFAGVGYLFLSGSVSVMSGRGLTLENLPVLLLPGELVLWLPGLLFGLALYLLIKRYGHWLIYPGMVLGAIASFYILLWFIGWSPDQAREAGWLLILPQEGSFWPAISLGGLAEIHWGVVLAQGAAILALFAINAISLLLDASGIELMTKRDLDLNRELKSNGAANVLTGLLGGATGVHSVGNTAFTHQLSGCNRLSALGYVVFSLLALVFGPVLVAVFPLQVLGGLFSLVGYGFIDEWLIQGRRRFPLLDYALVILILVSIAVFGVLPGVAIGFILAVLQFAFAYSRLDSVKFALSGKEMDTYVDRPEAHRAELSREGERIHALVLKGFLFFGSTNALLDCVKKRVEDPGMSPVRFLLLDFRLVDKMDTSVAQCFEKLLLLADRYEFEIVLTDLSKEFVVQLESIGIRVAGDSRLHVFNELSAGGRWCQDELLRSGGLRPTEILNFTSFLVSEWGLGEDAEIFASFFNERKLGDGEILFEAGDLPDGLYVVTRGRLRVYLNEAGKARRLRLIGSGGVLGEMALYALARRSASASASGAVTVQHLSACEWEKLRNAYPKLAEHLHMHVVGLLSQRLDKANLRLLRALG